MRIRIASSRRWTRSHATKYHSEHKLPVELQKEYVAACALAQMLIIARDLEGADSAETARQKWLQKLRGKVTVTTQIKAFVPWLSFGARAGATGVPGEVWVLNKVEERSSSAQLISSGQLSAGWGDRRVVAEDLPASWQGDEDLLWW